MYPNLIKEQLNDVNTFQPVGLECRLIMPKNLPRHRFKPIIMHAMVRDDPKLADDTGKVLKPNGVTGRLIPNCEIVSLLD